MVHWDQEKLKKSLITRLLVLMALALAIILWLDESETASGSIGALAITESSILPLRELSGSALRSLPHKAGDAQIRELLSVSDSEPKIVRTQIDANGKLIPGTNSEQSFGSLLIERFSFCQSKATKECVDQMHALTSQWEAIAVDGIGRIFVVQETTSMVVVFDAKVERIEAVMSFDFFTRRDGRHMQPGKKGGKSLAEGLVLLKNGHLLIAKESSPATLVEFGPAGHQPLGLSVDTLLGDDAFALPVTSAKDLQRLELTQLAVWTRKGASGKCDQSDLIATADGRLFVLSQKCRQITAYDGLKPGESDVAPAAIWTVPKKVKNPEALAVLGPRRFVVGSDIKSDKPNLFLLEE